MSEDFASLDKFKLTSRQIIFSTFSKNLILNSGREYASDIHAVVTTFSVVVSSEMAPGRND